MNSFGFDRALICLRNGFKVTRLDWESGSYIVKQRGYPEGVPINKNTSEATGKPIGTIIVFKPYIMLYEKGSFIPWAASQNDLLSNDWYRVE